MILDKKWTLKNTSKIEDMQICKSLDISLQIYQILKNRGVNDEKESKIFMNPSLKYLRDPFLMKDMKIAVDRIKAAIENNERIWIYGDYDVDGVSSTSILCLYFKSINFLVKYYIPNRLEEGYGINVDAINKIYEQGCDLLISVDCGITSVIEVDLANSLGIDVIITDHHECQSEIPNALAIINPKQETCPYPFDGLCGCAVAFKLIQALTPPDEFENSMYDYLEITTLATICDIVPVVDENRIIVKNGLNLMKTGKNLGLKELIKVCGVDQTKIGSSHIGYSIGPRINASGRLGLSYLGVELFTTDVKDEAVEIANILESKNIERQLIEAKMYHEAEEIIKSDKRYLDENVMVIAKEGWQHGIIGIVASKITEKYYKPTILLTIEENEATGSARSIKGFSIFDALTDSKELLTKFGGHEQAAGLSLKSEDIQTLRQKVNEFAKENLNPKDLIENINIDLELEEDEITLDLVEELHKLEPYGVGNPTPKFILRNAVIKDIRIMGQNKNHIKFTIEKEKQYECIGFNMAYLKDNFSVKDKVDVLFQLDENNYMGNRKVQFLLKDMRISYPNNPNLDEKSLELFSHIAPKDKDNLYEINILDDEKIENYKKLLKGNKNINVFDYFDENTLVIANSINGFFRAISDISLINLKYDVNFNVIEKNSDKLQLIFSPNIDKIDLKRYNNIILYDCLYSIGQYSYLYENKNESTNIINYYTELDLLYVKNILESVIPNREEFVAIYKMLLQNNSMQINFKDIKNTFGLIPIKLFTILKVFSELSLLKFNFDYDRKNISITLLPKPDKKLDLNESLILNNLQRLNQEYLKNIFVSY